MEFSSRIFIDGGDPQETKEADELLKKAGYHGLDGQTTNPTLIAKRAPSGVNALDFYKRTVVEMSKIIPSGTISIQVIGDPSTITIEDMVSQARDRITWIPNGIIKLPCTEKGLAAAEIFCREGPVNITLNFSQEQAAAVYVSTKSHIGNVYISPFVGRLDDRGEKGMDVVSHILEMYRAFGDGHVRVLTASVRNIQHILYAFLLKSDIITIPFKIFQEWVETGFAQPKPDFFYDAPGLVEIPYQKINLEHDWKSYNLRHELTDVGLSRFWEDWKAVTR